MNHQIYEDLSKRIGEDATRKVAEFLGGDLHYFPKINREPGLRFRGLEYPEVRSLALELRRKNMTGGNILTEIKKRWPDDTSRWISSSAIYRFFDNVSKGRMKHLGIDEMFREIGG